MISGNMARLAGLGVMVVGTFLVGEADAGGWRSRRGGGRGRPVECCERMVVEPCCPAPVATNCCRIERVEPRVHHHTVYDACGCARCVEHVTMERVVGYAPVRETVVVEERRPAVVDSVCCSSR
jgi:hypothetical protein